MKRVLGWMGVFALVCLTGIMVGRVMAEAISWLIDSVGSGGIFALALVVLLLAIRIVRA
jgi:hypothetical protein